MCQLYATVSKSMLSLRKRLKIQCLTTQLSPNLVCHYATVTKILVLLRNCHQNMVSFGGGPRVGKRIRGCIGPSRAKLLSYFAALARGRVAYVGYVRRFCRQVAPCWCLCCLYDGILSPSCSMLAPKWRLFGTK